jgi:hypothetical protein
MLHEATSACVFSKTICDTVRNDVSLVGIVPLYSCNVYSLPSQTSVKFYAHARAHAIFHDILLQRIQETLRRTTLQYTDQLLQTT